MLSMKFSVDINGMDVLLHLCLLSPSYGGIWRLSNLSPVFVTRVTSTAHLRSRSLFLLMKKELWNVDRRSRKFMSTHHVRMH
jgi:hypothetical protein